MKQIDVSWADVALVTAREWAPAGQPAADPLEMGPDTWDNPLSPYFDPARAKLANSKV